MAEKRKEEAIDGKRDGEKERASSRAEVGGVGGASNKDGDNFPPTTKKSSSCD